MACDVRGIDLIRHELYQYSFLYISPYALYIYIYIFVAHMIMDGFVFSDVSHKHKRLSWGPGEFSQLVLFCGCDIHVQLYVRMELSRYLINLSLSLSLFRFFMHRGHECFGYTASGTFFFYSLISAATVLFTAKLIPETKGRTLEEIQASMTKFLE